MHPTRVPTDIQRLERILMGAEGIQEEGKHPFREPATSKLESTEMRKP